MIKYKIFKQKDSWEGMDNFNLGGIPKGLTGEEAAKRKSEGKVNKITDKNGKSYAKIIADNLFTFFNFIWAVITIV